MGVLQNVRVLVVQRGRTRGRSYAGERSGDAVKRKGEEQGQTVGRGKRETERYREEGIEKAGEGER